MNSLVPPIWAEALERVWKNYMEGNLITYTVGGSSGAGSLESLAATLRKLKENRTTMSKEQAQREVEKFSRKLGALDLGIEWDEKKGFVVFDLDSVAEVQAR